MNYLGNEVIAVSIKYYDADTENYKNYLKDCKERKIETEDFEEEDFCAVTIEFKNGDFYDVQREKGIFNYQVGCQIIDKKGDEIDENEKKLKTFLIKIANEY